MAGWVYTHTSRSLSFCVFVCVCTRLHIWFPSGESSWIRLYALCCLTYTFRVDLAHISNRQHRQVFTVKVDKHIFISYIMRSLRTWNLRAESWSFKQYQTGSSFVVFPIFFWMTVCLFCPFTTVNSTYLSYWLLVRQNNWLIRNWEKMSRFIRYGNN